MIIRREPIIGRIHALTENQWKSAMADDEVEVVARAPWCALQVTDDFDYSYTEDTHDLFLEVKPPIIPPSVLTLFG